MRKTCSAALAALFGIGILILSACGGGGGGGAATAAAGSTTYTISGKVTVNGAGLGQVALTLADGTSVTSQSTGAYSFSGLAGGSYVVTPTLAGYTFTPASLTVAVDGASVTGQDFTATPVPSYAISGKVLAANGAGLAGATVTMTKTTAGATPITVTSDASGSYLRGSLLAGDYLVTVSHPTGGTFTPASQTVTVTAGIASANFTSSAAATYAISGKVTLPDGTPKGQVPLILTIETSSTTFATVTDTSGSYAFAGLPAGDYVIHPSPLAGYYFYPDPLLVRVSGSDAVNKNIEIQPAGTASLGGSPTTSP